MEDIVSPERRYVPFDTHWMMPKAYVWWIKQMGNIRTYVLIPPTCLASPIWGTTEQVVQAAP